MSHYLHHMVEVRDKDNKWNLFTVLARPCSYMEKDQPERIIKVNDQNYYLEKEFVTSYLSLRDNYFGSWPWRNNNNFDHGVPKDADPQTSEFMEQWVNGGYHIYNCTVSELENEAEKVFREWKDKRDRDRIMEFSVDFAKRLGYGNKDGEYEPEYNINEELDDLMSMHHQLVGLSSGIRDMVEAINPEYYVNGNDIRIIIWTD